MKGESVRCYAYGHECHAHQILHIALRLCELHLIHTLTRIPMQEGTALEHLVELRMRPLKDLLDCSRV